MAMEFLGQRFNAASGSHVTEGKLLAITHVGVLKCAGAQVNSWALEDPFQILPPIAQAAIAKQACVEVGQYEAA